MSLSPLWTAVLLPPANLMVAGFTASLTRWRAGRMVAALCAAVLIVLALPYTAGLLEASLWTDSLAAPTAQKPGAVIILSGDTRSTAGPDWATEPGPLTLERLRRGAAFARESGLPILVSGGIPDSGGPAIAELMARSLHDDFRLDAAWTEIQSEDTLENALRSAAILRREGVDSAFLVTHAWHMRRAALAFAKAGFPVTAVPVRIDHLPTGSLSDFLPTPQALLSSFYSLHEWIGFVDYALFR